mmetsp:Transcript_12357/g.24623  ORF Transcript_12357/g.24623 Transcript_12357/m.24623 type:complete len:213 (-) Transcript_12357:395-1033(-)
MRSAWYGTKPRLTWGTSWQRRRGEAEVVHVEDLASSTAVRDGVVDGSALVEQLGLFDDGDGHAEQGLHLGVAVFAVVLGIGGDERAEGGDDEVQAGEARGGEDLVLREHGERVLDEVPGVELVEFFHDGGDGVGVGELRAALLELGQGVLVAAYVHHAGQGVKDAGEGVGVVVEIDLGGDLLPYLVLEVARDGGVGDARVVAGRVRDGVEEL